MISPIVNTTHSGRRVLRSGGPNHSKPLSVPRFHTPLDRAFLDCPQAHPTLRIRRVQSATRLEKSPDSVHDLQTTTNFRIDSHVIYWTNFRKYIGSDYGLVCGFLQNIGREPYFRLLSSWDEWPSIEFILLALAFSPSMFKGMLWARLLLSLNIFHKCKFHMHK